VPLQRITVTNKTIQLTERLYEYLIGVSLREPEILRRLRAETSALPEAEMQIAPEQGQFMALLCELMGARRALEVGVFTGYSALSVALALPPDGRLIACDVNAEWTAIARRYWDEAGVGGKIDLRLAPAAETLAALLAGGGAGSFDLAFIDADKEGYRDYYELCLKLLRPGGLVVVDNVLWSGQVADPAVHDPATDAIRRFNAFVHADERVRVALLPVADGLTLALKRPTS
jgi:predicted O-methyltransferase YrrM